MTPSLCMMFLSFFYIFITCQSWLLSPRTFKVYEAEVHLEAKNKANWEIKADYRREGCKRCIWEYTQRKWEGENVIWNSIWLLSRKMKAWSYSQLHKPLLFNEESARKQWAHSAPLYNTQLFSTLPGHVWLIRSMLLTLGWSMGGSVTGWHSLHRASAKSTHFKTGLLKRWSDSTTWCHAHSQSIPSGVCLLQLAGEHAAFPGADGSTSALLIANQ